MTSDESGIIPDVLETTTSIRRPVRRRVAAVALSVVLFALVAYWASLDAEDRGPRERARRPVRSRVPFPPLIVACETISVVRPVWTLSVASSPRSPRRLTRFRPTRPKPFDWN